LRPSSARVNLECIGDGDHLLSSRRLASRWISWSVQVGNSRRTKFISWRISAFARSIELQHGRWRRGVSASVIDAGPPERITALGANARIVAPSTVHRQDLAVDAGLAYAARDQLRVL
jgi:hypothetical protein